MIKIRQIENFIGIHRTSISIILALISASFLSVSQKVDDIIILILNPKIIELLDKPRIYVKIVILWIFFAVLFRAFIDWFFKYRDNDTIKNYEEGKKSLQTKEIDKEAFLSSQILPEKSDERGKSIQHVIQAKPNEFDLALSTLRAKGNPDDIIAIFNFVAKHDDKYFFPLKREVADIAYLTGKIDTVVESVKAILSRKPNNIYALTMMGHCYMYHSNFLEAGKFYNQALENAKLESKPLII